MGTNAVTLGQTTNVTLMSATNALSVGGVISGTGFGLTLTGPGILDLYGANAYTGAGIDAQSRCSTLNIGSNNGTVAATGSINSASALVMNGGTVNLVNTGSRHADLQWPVRKFRRRVA